jgi:hypothetical protein
LPGTLLADRGTPPVRSPDTLNPSREYGYSSDIRYAKYRRRSYGCSESSNTLGVFERSTMPTVEPIFTLNDAKFTARVEQKSTLHVGEYTASIDP